MKTYINETFGDFKCIHCRSHVSANPFLSGVHNRNHCPYCLWSRHLDLYRSGDRLAACKGQMRPIGLALKKTNKKYGKDQGELMLVHQCLDCGKVSANRIAADDIADYLYEVYEHSLDLDCAARRQIQDGGVEPLNAQHAGIVEKRLFGRVRSAHLPAVVTADCFEMA